MEEQENYKVTIEVTAVSQQEADERAKHLQTIGCSGLSNESLATLKGKANKEGINGRIKKYHHFI